MGGRFAPANAIIVFVVLLGIVSLVDAWLISSSHKIRSFCCLATPNAEIIGNGRIGAFLAEAGNSKVLGREDRIDPNLKGNPILIATRNDALDNIVETCPEERRTDLVFLQNGYLDDFLQSKDLLDNTQVLLYLSVSKKGVSPVDGVTAVNPEGLTAVTGRHAEAFAARLAALNMKCRVLSPTDYRPAMFEKLM
jgi:hypothetical protein